jgi:hypothetical protein
MRVFSDNVKAIMASGKVAIFYLVEIIAPSVTIRDTTAVNSITVAGVGTFDPNNGLSIVEGPKLSEAVDRQNYKITYIDPEFQKRELFESILTGSTARTFVGFYNPFPTALGGAEEGQPLCGIDDLIVAYAGVVDTQGYAIDPSNGTVIAVVECASPMASLGLVKSFYTTKNAMARFDANDTCFDQVTTSAAKTTFLWGKAA